jgi:RNA polymerase sigma factor (TIGR02999 family)
MIAMAACEPNEVTILLQRWRGGDQDAYDLLVGRVYTRLLAIATGLAAGDRFATSPAGLVNEAYLRLRQLQRVQWKDRNHFFAFATTQMRRILIEQARKRMAAKRDEGMPAGRISTETEWNELPGAALLDLDAALERLTETDPELARLIELRYLMGYSVP